MDEHQKSLKTAWKATTREQARQAFPFEGSFMEELFAAVADAVEKSGCDHSLAATERWLDSHKLPRQETIAWLKANGGYCDCEVIANAADHWEQNS